MPLPPQDPHHDELDELLSAATTHRATDRFTMRVVDSALTTPQDRLTLARPRVLVPAFAAAAALAISLVVTSDEKNDAYLQSPGYSVLDEGSATSLAPVFPPAERAVASDVISEFAEIEMLLAVENSQDLVRVGDEDLFDLLY